MITHCIEFIFIFNNVEQRLTQCNSRYCSYRICDTKNPLLLKMDPEKVNDLWIKFQWKEIYEIKGKSGEHGMLGGSIRITESGKGLNHPKGPHN